MEMSIEEMDGQYTCIRLTGRMDMEGTRAIDTQFGFATATRSLKLVVDLTGTSFLASIGLRTLLTAARAQAGRGGRMAIVAPAGLVRQTLEMAGVDRIVPVHDDWPGAQAALRAG